MVRFLSDNRVVEKTTAVPLQVIAAGAPRSATSSMQQAFEQLGYAPCQHMANIIPHPDRMRLLIRAAREKDRETRQKLILELVEGHASLCDLPVIFFTADLMDMYPDAKIVLNRRSSTQLWVASAHESLGFFFTRTFSWLGWLWAQDRLWYDVNVAAMDLCEERYNQRYPISAEVYEGHLEWVREECKKRGKECLEFMPEEGWGPLCKFLGKPVPDTPFPKANEAVVFKIVRYIIIARGIACWTGLGLSVWAGVRYGPTLAGWAMGAAEGLLKS